jgi:methyl-accepting chemotaxis protein
MNASARREGAKVKIDNLKLRTKVLIPVAAMALVIVGMVGFGAAKLTDISESASEIIEHRDFAANHTVRAGREMVQTSAFVFGALTFDGNSPAGQAAKEGFPKAVAGAQSDLAEAAKLLPDHAAEIGKFGDRFQAAVEKAKAPLKIGLEMPGIDHGSKLKAEELDQMAEGARILAEVDVSMRALVDDLATFNTGMLADNAKAAAELRAESSAALIALIVSGVAAIVLTGAFAFWISSSKISGPLSRLADKMRSLSEGDLSVEIEGQNRLDEVGDMSKAVLVFRNAAVENARLEREAAENRAQADNERANNEQAQREAVNQERVVVASSIGAALSKLAAKDLTYRMPTEIPDAYRKLQADFNAAIAQLEEAMRSVSGSTDAIQSGTREISSASDDLSRRTEQQAASLEETAAALDEITATVKKSAQGASHARKVVATADEDAKKSALVVRQAVEAMDAIAKSAQQISQIIGVIDEIAFQTNLLALNAGVEAARAGDAGRGFAVVASEVRALAQRSAEAAKEIKGLISASTTQVDNGVRLVAETGQSLERIMAQVAEINTVVGEIAAGAHEQATGLDQVNTAVNQMDQVTQQNAAMVEESTAASHSLSQETSQLSSLVGQFQVGRAGPGEDTMRRELQKVAPHAFREPAEAPARPAVRKAAARPVRAMQNVVVNGSPGNEPGGWEEF